jgi:hypothetical protein
MTNKPKSIYYVDEAQLNTLEETIAKVEKELYEKILNVARTKGFEYVLAARSGLGREVQFLSNQTNSKVDGYADGEVLTAYTHALVSFSKKTTEAIRQVQREQEALNAPKPPEDVVTFISTTYPCGCEQTTETGLWKYCDVHKVQGSFNVTETPNNGG